MGFVGDLIQDRGREQDHVHSYDALAELLSGFDLTSGNLEFPVHPGRPVGPPPFSVRFNGSPMHLDALAAAGFDVLWTANNHSYDQELEGLKRTLDEIERRGIVAVGTARNRESLLAPTVVEVRGYRIALCAYTGLGPGTK